MPDVRVFPDKISFSAATTALGGRGAYLCWCCAQGGFGELALDSLGLMTQLHVMRDGVTYNAVLDAAFDKRRRSALFDEARGLGHFPMLLQRGDSFLELHDLSCGAAVLAVRWWLEEVIPRL
ncbi:unnamed protein product [Polarella glacialis]|uniref:Uncharacterized protein n=1 Tax=Polarella glacialis TaxID=89957 RepID=A0A813JC75_POLGL|nr:unnamed protein product [Polarella glacialis]CAE8721445.1 unnamed protein product [Polarella glacialis]